jgi:hypothetical protein
MTGALIPGVHQPDRVEGVVELAPGAWRPVHGLRASLSGYQVRGTHQQAGKLSKPPGPAFKAAAQGDRQVGGLGSGTTTTACRCVH